MQENSMDQPTSLSQLLRESYLAEARAHHRHGESSCIDSPRRLVYGTLKEKADDTEPQFPDLSAFLSQDELDKSVDLACKAFSSDPREREERSDAHPPVSHYNLPSSKPTPETEVISERQTPAADFKRPQRNAPYGLETQSKKEFLNKAADFIEELSSLFKASSSKRIRPRACKTHRSRFQNKTQLDGTSYSIDAEDRERPILLNQQMEEPMEKSGVTEEPQEPALIQTESSEEPVCEPPHFIQKLKSREVPEGSKVQLDCIVRGLPAPEVRWFCEGKELENSPDIQIIANGERHTLIIAEAFEEDTGRYSCFASNFYGTDSTSAEIYIEGMKNTPNLQFCFSTNACVFLTFHMFCFQTLNGSSSYLQSFDVRPMMAAPVFTKNLQDVLAVESQLVVLECRVKGIPSPKVDWYREGTLIEDSPDFRILQKKPRSMAESEEICTLVIAEVFPEDSGTFTCIASNKYGTVSSTAVLRVKGNFVLLLRNLLLDQLKTRPTVKPIPDPPTSCLKTRPEGVLGNHNESRSSSQVGLRVTFKLLEDEDEEEKGMSSKEPPPVLAKPKLDPVQLQILHNQVLLEQRQEDASPSQDSPHLDRTSCEPSPVKPTHPPANSVPSQLQPPPLVMNSAPIPLQIPASVPLLPTAPAPILKAVPVSQLSMPLTNSINQPAPIPSPMSPPPTQSPPQASSPTSSSSTPSPIQNPVAFLSSVFPSLPISPPTNAMGLPKRAPPGPQGALKKNQRGSRLMSDDDIRESKETLLQDIEKKLQFKDEQLRFGQQEYKVSSFEQRLLSEIEFHLERTPVEESDDEVQHDEIPSGKCIAPIFDKKLKHFRAVEGIPVTFTCKVVGIPIPKVYWFKDGKQILKKNVHYKKIREGDGTCSLHIEAVTSDDDGNYTVMAVNPQGRISCSGHLIVQTGPVRNRPMVHSQRVRARVQEVEGEPAQERCFRPHFLQAPGDMSAHEGRLCRLDCKVSGLPHPEIMWLLNGKPIYPDLTHRMLVRENGIHSLAIDSLTQADDGTYTCIASNKAGQSSFGLELRVVEKELKQAPHFVEKLQNTGIAEGSPVRLGCRVVGMPQPLIFWKKDNDTIPHSKDRVSMHQDTTGYVCLLIQPTRKEDAGWYTVSAKNEAGIISCTARLDIYAQWYQHVHAPMKKTQLSGSRYAALTGQGLDIKSAFSMSDNGPVIFSASQPERRVESEEL
uniref:Myopalladin-like n=1 Tax=Sinocyclocheilus anshuiensis TaxID=1608454 RepID=A0A671LPP3_9TELE